MGFTKKMKTGLANVKKEFSEQTQVSMQTVSVQTSTLPQNNSRLEELRRKSGPGRQNDATRLQSNGSLGRPVSAATSFNTAPPVPPHRAPTFSATSMPGDDTLKRASQPMLARKPTYSDSLVKSCPISSEKPLPTMNPSQPLSEDPLMCTNTNRVPQAPSLEVTEASGKLLEQHAETPTSGVERTENPERVLHEAIVEQSEKIQEKEHEVKALCESNNQHLVKIERLESELRQEKERHAQTTQAWRKTTQALSNNRPEANYKVDDDTLRKDYQNIIYEVSSWVTTYCVPNFDHIPDSEMRVFSKLTQYPPKYYEAKYYGSERTRELLLQSLVMHVLVDLVFDRLYWAGKQAGSLRDMQLALMPDEARDIPTLLTNKILQPSEVRDYSAWKAKTALLMSERAKRPAVQTNIGGICADMQNVLKPFVQRTSPNAWRELETVIHKAIVLDHEFNKSRALFQVNRWSVKDVEEMQFDEGMATPNGLKAARRGMDVELVLAPMITKTGRADGDAFECLTLISPWMVVCKENRKQLQKR